MSFIGKITPKLPHEATVEKTPILNSTAFYPGLCSPENAVDRRKYWQPATLRSPFLLASLFSTLVLLSIVLFLHYQDHKHGAIILAKSNNEFSYWQTFLFRYFPMIVFVAFGFMISMIDLDVKRLEPWYQLSTNSPLAKGKALLCRYDTQFVLTVIAKAASNRHWIVICCSLLLVLATMVVPAIQNSIFITRLQSISRSTLLAAQPSLSTPIQQQEALTVNFLTTAYGIIWLGQSLPAFTSKEVAITPLELPASSVSNIKQTTVTSRSTQYWSELTCWSPTSVTTNYTTNRTSLADGRGCTATDIVDFRSLLVTSLGLFKGSYYGPLVDPSLPTLTLDDLSLQAYCPQSPHLILFTWILAKPNNTAPNFGPGGDASALFCEPEYYMQDIDATVSAVNGSVLATTPTGEKKALGEDIFNRTNFEIILASGANRRLYPDSNQTELLIDIAEATPVVQNARLREAGVAEDTDALSLAMPGFVLGLAGSRASSLLNTSTLQQALTKAYQLNFALAMNRLFTSHFETTDSATMISLQNSVHVVPVFAIITELLLATIAVLCGWLHYLSLQRVLRLLRDPESLSDLMSLSSSPQLQRKLNKFNLISDEHEFRQRLDQSDVCLELKKSGEPRLECSDSISMEPHIEAGGTKKLPESRQKVERLLELSPASFISVHGILCGSIALILVLDIISTKQGGIAMFPTTDIVKQILFNFLPTAFAILLGAYITLLCRVYSFLRPMEDLRKGGAMATKTLSMRYTSSLPALIFIKTWRARHYLLGVLSIITLLSNTVLTVTIASLFVSGESAIPKEVGLEAMYQPVVMIDDPRQTLAAVGDSNTQNVDSIYTAVANITESTILPPWTTSDYAFLPVNLSAAVQMPGMSHLEFEATGYGADLDCVDLLHPPPSVSSALEFRMYQNSWLMRLWANYTQPDGEIRSCWFHHKRPWDDFFGQIFGSVSGDTMAFEMSNSVRQTNSTLIPEEFFCGNQTVKGWVRGRVQQAANANGSIVPQFTHDATVVSCSPRLRRRQHLIRVSPEGDMLATQPLGPINYDVIPTMNFTETLNDILRLTNAQYDQPLWHNDTVARDWSNYIYKKILNSTDLLDATKPPPSFEDASKLMSETFSRLFAIQISFHRKYLLPLNVSARAFSTWDTSAIPDTPPGPYTIPARAYYSASRIFMSQPNFIISTAILILDLIVLIVFRIRLSKPFLPKIPYTIASQIAYFAGSHVVDDVVEVGGDCKVLDAKGNRYGYGRYVGKDGLEHVGIERMEFLVPEKEDKERREMKTGSGNFSWAGLWKGRQPTVKGSIKLRPGGFESVPGHDRSGSNESAKSLRGDNWI